MKSRVGALLGVVLCVCIVGQLDGVKGAKEAAKDKDVAKKKHKHVSFFLAGERSGSAKSIHEIIEQEVEKSHAILKRRDSMGPDPDSFSAIDLSSPGAVERAKQQAKNELEAVVESVDRLKFSGQNRVIASWLQIQMAERDKEKWLRVLNQESLWGLTKSGVDGVKKALEKLERQNLMLHYFVWFQLYKQTYERVLGIERLIPGSGNLHKILLDPERLKRRVPLLAIAYGCRSTHGAGASAAEQKEEERKEDANMLAMLREKKKADPGPVPDSPTEVSSDSSSSDQTHG